MGGSFPTAGERRGGGSCPPMGFPSINLVERIWIWIVRIDGFQYQFTHTRKCAQIHRKQKEEKTHKNGSKHTARARECARRRERDCARDRVQWAECPRRNGKAGRGGEGISLHFLLDLLVSSHDFYTKQSALPSLFFNTTEEEGEHHLELEAIATAARSSPLNFGTEVAVVIFIPRAPRKG